MDRPWDGRGDMARIEKYPDAWKCKSNPYPIAFIYLLRIVIHIDAEIFYMPLDPHSLFAFELVWFESISLWIDYHYIEWH